MRTHCTLRGFALLLSLAATAAGCFQPVAVGVPEAGTDGGGPGSQQGGDGGADATHEDGGVACQVASDCSSAPVACLYTRNPVASTSSCVAGACVQECPGGRSCDVAQGDGGICLVCEGARADCATRCQVTGTYAVSFTQVTCEPGFDAGVFEGQYTWTPGARGDCHYELPPLGWMAHLESNDSVAGFPMLGGLCTGKNLATGVPRTQWSCPKCTFVMVGWE